MISKDNIIENRFTGEKIIFKETSKDTNGKYVTYDYYAKPNQPISPKHFHPNAEESFEVIRGNVRFEFADGIKDAKAGDYVVMKPGTVHTGYNIGSEELYLKAKIEPALHYEQYYRTCFKLAEQGKVNKKGVPNLLQLAAMMYYMKDETFLPKGILAQKIFFNVVGPIAKLLGYKSNID